MKVNIVWVDPDGDKIYYMWDWGDGTYSQWVGPYNSDDICSMTYKWTTKGTYEIRVKAKDIYDAESDWVTLTIGIQKNKVIIIRNLFLRFIENNPTLYQILQRFLKI